MANNGTSARHDNGSGSPSRRLRNGDERLRALVSSILSDTSDAVLLVDADGTVQSGNAAAARLIGVRTRQLKGVKLGDLIEPAALRNLCGKAASRRRAVTSGSSLNLTSRDGTERSVGVAVRAVGGRRDRRATS